jgi:Domain of unknown function (DUF4417)
MLPAEAHKHVWMLKDRGSAPLHLGCVDCLDHQVCGGLHLPPLGIWESGCLTHCRCANPSKCDLVCPNVPTRFVARVREVHGLSLDNIPPARDLALPDLPDALPIFDGNCGGKALSSLDFAVIPLTRALRRDGGSDRARTAQELSRSHGVRPRIGWVLTGVQDDRHVERTWRLRSSGVVFAQMKRSGVVMATTPNYSLYADVPRHDNLHAMKRIAWMWYLMQEAGLPTALHINGRTDYDFQRWATFAAQHPELKAVAFEFLTGASGVDDVPVYVSRLKRFAETVGRPLWLLIRGHNELRHVLASSFARVIVLDANPYQKTIHRRAGHLTNSGRLRFSQAPTETPKQVAALLRHNLAVWQSSLEAPLKGQARQQTLDLRDSDHSPGSAAAQRSEADHETRQFVLFG